MIAGVGLGALGEVGWEMKLIWEEDCLFLEAGSSCVCVRLCQELCLPLVLIISNLIIIVSHPCSTVLKSSFQVNPPNLFKNQPFIVWVFLASINPENKWLIRTNF